MVCMKDFQQRSTDSIDAEVESILSEYEQDIAVLASEAEELFLEYSEEVNMKKIAELRTKLAFYEKS